MVQNNIKVYIFFFFFFFSYCTPCFFFKASLLLILLSIFSEVESLDRMVQLHSFACRYPVFSTSSVEKTVFSPLTSLSIFAENHLTIHMKTYFWILYSIPFPYMSVFMPVLHCFD